MKLFETFSGIGAQHKALKNLHKKGLIGDFETLGISEWYISAIIAYSLIHHNKEFNKEIHKIDDQYGLNAVDPKVKKSNEKKLKDFILKELEDETFSTNSKDPANLNRVNITTLKQLYVGRKVTNNLGSVLGVVGEELPKGIDVLTYSFPCFIEGTLILTNKGYKKIEDITTKDKVLTHNNKFQKVVKPMINHADHIYQLKSMASEDIYVTEEHPFYVRKKEKLWNKSKKKQERVFSKPEWVEVKDLTKDYYLGIGINQKSKLPEWNGVEDKRFTKNKKQINELKEKMKEKDFWWLVGIYLADGWNQISTDKNNYRTIICASKKNNQHKKIEKKLEKLDFKYSKVKEETTYKYHICQKELTIFLEQFGKYAHGKEINNTIMDLPVKYLKKFIQGFIFGDGSYIKKTQKYSITSVSSKLIYGLGQCVAKAYKTPYGIYKHKNDKKTKIQGREVNQRDTYIIRFKLRTKKQDKAFYEDNYIWFPYSKLEKQEYKGRVYNFEVENDNSYTVNNIIVHNCQDLSAAGKRKGLGRGTRSGLLWEIGRILVEAPEENRPNILLMENVPTLFQKFGEGWNTWKEELKDLGYTSYDITLNSKDFNMAQHRRRAFSIAVKNNSFDMEKFNGFDLRNHIEETQTWKEAEKIIDKKGLAKIKTILEKGEIEERYYIDKPFNILKSTDGATGVKFDLIDHSSYEIANRIYDTEFGSPTITTSGMIKIYDDQDKKIIRMIKEVEAFKLMGFEKSDFEKVEKNFTKGHLYRFAGNSIAVHVLEGLFEVIEDLLQNYRK